MSVRTLQAIERIIEVTRGTDTPIPFTLQLDADGQPAEENETPVDLTGDTVRFVVKSTPGATTALIDTVVSSHTAPLLGQTSVTVTDAETEAMLALGVSHVTAFYELRHIESGPSPPERVFYKGAFRVVETPRAPSLG